VNEVTEALDDDLRANIAASLPNLVVEYIDPPECDETPTEPLVTEKPSQPKLNRAERRRLTRDIVRTARRKARKAERRQNLAIRELRGKRCARCNLLFIGRAQWRCMCKAVVARKEAEVASNV
jgi:hypothetical protein